jgi:tRNA G10  N-methylase Trm11
MQFEPSIVGMSRISQTIRLFIPGKNWILSLAELAAYLQARGAEFQIEVFSKAFFVIGVNNPQAIDIAALGGTIKVGEVTAELSTQAVKNAFLEGDKQAQAEIRDTLLSKNLTGQMFEKPSVGKAVFGVSVYWADSAFRPVAKRVQRFIGSAVKKENKRANFMGFAKDRVYPQLSHVEVLKKSMVENRAEVLFCVGKEQTFVAVTVAVHDPFEFQKRDVGKPRQRKIFAIPPRLARIMVNLACCTEGKVFLDPFCGVGTILQEALLAKAKVVGVDVNRWCMEAARRNLEWLTDEYSLENAEYRVLQGDVRKLSEKVGREQVDCIATEPDLGPALRQVPTTSYAMRLVERLESLYHALLEEAYKVLKRNGRLVFVSPYVKTRSGQPVTMRVEEKALAVGFKRVYPFQKEFFAGENAGSGKLKAMVSLVDVGERHIIGRELHVFQK